MQFTPHLLLAGVSLALATPAAAVNIFDVGPNSITTYHITGTGTIDEGWIGEYLFQPFFYDSIGKAVTVDLQFDLVTGNVENGHISVGIYARKGSVTRMDNGYGWGAWNTADSTVYYTSTPDGIVVSDIYISDFYNSWTTAFNASVNGGYFFAFLDDIESAPPGLEIEYEATTGSVTGTWAVSTASVTPLGGETRYYVGPDFQPAAPAIPEPASWALLILGFGTIGATIRRRRRVDPASLSAHSGRRLPRSPW